MRTLWDIGDSVRVIRNLRNDGTYAGTSRGDLLVRRGSTGTIIDIGTFLLDQVIYTVHFLDVDRMVGCREEELIGSDEPWVASAFESRERVVAGKKLVLGNTLNIECGSTGEVMQVVREGDLPFYHVHFDCLPGRLLAVPESALLAANEVAHA